MRASAGYEAFDLSGRVAIVTGSTRGIGRAIATAFARAGVAVVISGRDQAECDGVANAIRETTGTLAFPLACDVGEWELIPQFVDRIAEQFGRIDILVNNAGICPEKVSVTDMTQQYWRRLFSVNVEGPLRLAQCVAPVMRIQGHGVIVNVTSVGAGWGSAETCAYRASKAALLNLTKSMAQEWISWGIRVNAVSPGPFSSEMLDDPVASPKARAAEATLMRRIADPEEIVGTFIYIASDAGSFITGAEVSVSGGMHVAG